MRLVRRDAVLAQERHVPRRPLSRRSAGPGSRRGRRHSRPVGLPGARPGADRSRRPAVAATSCRPRSIWATMSIAVPSKGVIDRLLLRAATRQALLLRGNHEVIMELALSCAARFLSRTGARSADWRRFCPTASRRARCSERPGRSGRAISPNACRASICGFFRCWRPCGRSGPIVL